MASVNASDYTPTTRSESWLEQKGLQPPAAWRHSITSDSMDPVTTELRTLLRNR
jgi:hypothetical protein